MGDTDKGGEPDSIQRCLVYCRLRPTKPGEINDKDGVYKLVELSKKQIKLGEEKTYNFDGNFNPDCTQEDIFQEVARPSVEHIIKGYNAAIMAYGQTGTGKSFTMSNFKPGQEGIIPRSAGHLFELIEKTPTKSFSLSANFVQIYRDNLTDLMDEKQAKVDIRFTKEKGVELINCTTVKIATKEDFMAMYQEGDARRVVRPTKMNPESSRGHTALVLYIDVVSNDPNDMSRPVSGKITFIDLAGYERFDKTGIKAGPGNEHIVDEAKKINASLLSLGHVVAALSAMEKHIPWRNSKLTRLLQDSIGGKSRSTIMLTIGPASNHFHETSNSLNFGNVAMAIRSVAKQEQEVDYQKLAAKLQADLEERDAKIDSLEAVAKQRESERLHLEARFTRDTGRLRQRHSDELKQLMQDGGTAERIQKLLDAHEVEDENLQEEQFEEREFVRERDEEEAREMVKEIDAQHRVRAQSIKREVSESKQKELDAAYALIAQLRGVTDTGDIAKEISELAGTAAAANENGEETEEVASPRTSTSAEAAILRREIGELKEKAEADVQKMAQTKAAHMKCANLLKEAREQNKKLAKESVNVEQLQRLEGEVEELKAAKASAHEHYEELEGKLEDTRKQLHVRQAEFNAMSHKQAHAEKEAKDLLEKLDSVEAERNELAAKLETLDAEKSELGEEFNRKQREREAETETSGADAKRRTDGLASEIEGLKGRISELEAQIADLEAVNEALEAKLEEKERTIAEKEEEVRRGLEEIKAKEAELQASRSEYGQAGDAAEEKVRDLKKACEACKDETRSVSTQLQQEIEEIQSATSLQVATLVDKLETMTKDLDVEQQGVSEKESHQSAELQKQSEEFEEVRNELQRSVEEAEQEVEDMLKQLEEKDREMEALRADLDADRAALDEARDERELVEAEFNDYKENAEADMDRLKEDKEEMEKVHAEAMQVLEDDLANSLQITDALEKRIKELEEKLMELQGTLDTEKTNAQLELESLKTKSLEERRLREEEAAKSKQAREALQAQMEQRLEEEKKKKAGSKYKYKSTLVSKLADVGQIGTAPANAPPVNVRPADLLATLDIEEVKAALKYKVICIGAPGTGKSSVFKCITSEGSHNLLKKLPDVLNPTTAVSFADYVYKERKEGAFLTKRSGASTYFEVWDTPCDSRVLAGLPQGCLPAMGCCYALTFSLTNAMQSEGKKMAEVLQNLYTGCRRQHGVVRDVVGKEAAERSRKPSRMRIPVLLVGTKRDVISGSKDSSAVSKKISEAKRWFRECNLAAENFVLLDCVAVSCKEYTATYDTNRTNSPSFNGLMGVIAKELNKVYPNTPPCILQPGTSLGESVDLADWYAATQGVQTEKQRANMAIWKAVLTAAVHLGRLRKRNVWLMGSQEYEGIFLDHVPSHVQDSAPGVLKKFCEAFACRSYAMPAVQDVAQHSDDPRESFVVIGIQTLVQFVSTSLWLPSLYLSQLDCCAGEAPGYLKGVVQKATGFNVEEVWRPDWELMYDGRYSASGADKLLKTSKAFEQDPALGFDFLQSLGLAFPLRHTSPADNQLAFAPSVALCAIVSDLESLFLAAFKKHAAGWEASTAKSQTALAPSELLALQKELYEANEGKDVLLWGNGVAVSRPVDGDIQRWGYVKNSGTTITVCCEGKENNILPYLRALVDKASGENGKRLEWYEGMSLDQLPSLPPSAVDRIDRAPTLSAFFETMTPEQARGTTYPSAALDNNLKKWSRAAAGGGGRSKIDANRLAMFEADKK